MRALPTGFAATLLFGGKGGWMRSSPPPTMCVIGSPCDFTTARQTSVRCRPGGDLAVVAMGKTTSLAASSICRGSVVTSLGRPSNSIVAGRIEFSRLFDLHDHARLLTLLDDGRLELKPQHRLGDFQVGQLRGDDDRPVAQIRLGQHGDLPLADRCSAVRGERDDRLVLPFGDRDRIGRGDARRIVEHARA